ncbi:hypothetical protein RvY_07838 [Ramazzottius varieornatus]|uniref:Receptor ligand binding region domain-containing protein n=1 Tax=Ramazzottius varieornatus TaxID=947166 RepID=A0A1D1VBX6_RAMVA|nr:hypothetical protein RvY_07838 [Ramazzottius varieornatus]
MDDARDSVLADPVYRVNITFDETYPFSVPCTAALAAGASAVSKSFMKVYSYGKVAKVTGVIGPYCPLKIITTAIASTVVNLFQITGGGELIPSMLPYPRTSRAGYAKTNQYSFFIWMGQKYNWTKFVCIYDASNDDATADYQSLNLIVPKHRELEFIYLALKLRPDDHVRNEPAFSRFVCERLLSG